MTFKIVSDSSSNVFSIKDVAYSTVPLKIISSEKEYIDNAVLDVAGMVNDLKTVKGVVKTSCPNSAEWLDAFEGADCIFAVTITSNLSGCFNAAMVAKEQYITEHPGAKICVIDSYSTGGEMQLIIEKLSELITSGNTFEEIEQQIINYKNTTHLQFSLQSLTNLARNGRVSPAVAAIAGVLGIRVVGAAVEGTLHPSDKVRGEKKAVSTIYSNMKKNGYAGGKVRINHCFNPQSAQALTDKITAEFPSADISCIPCTALCSFYAEQGGMIIGYEGGTKN